MPETMGNMGKIVDQRLLHAKTTLQLVQIWQPVTTLHHNHFATWVKLASSNCSPQKQLCNLHGFGEQRLLPANKTLQLSRVWRRATTPHQNNSATCMDLATSGHPYMMCW